MDAKVQKEQGIWVVQSADRGERHHSCVLAVLLYLIVKTGVVLTDEKWRLPPRRFCQTDPYTPFSGPPYNDDVKRKLSGHIYHWASGLCRRTTTTPMVVAFRHKHAGA